MNKTYRLPAETKAPLLSSKEEKILIAKAQKGDKESLHILITRNTRLVLSIAIRYRGQGLDFPDLVQEGYLGLLKAIWKFNPDKSGKLSTYAVWLIRQNIALAVKGKGKIIAIPIYLQEKEFRVKKIIRETKKTLLWNHSLPEIARTAGFEEKIVNNFFLLPQFVSLDYPLFDDEPKELSNTIPTPNSSPLELAISNEDRHIFLKLLSQLKEKEEVILRLYYGFDLGIPASLETTAARNCHHSFRNISKRFGISRARASQIKERALNKMRLMAKQWFNEMSAESKN